MGTYQIHDRFGLLEEAEYPSDRAAGAVAYGYAARCPSGGPYTAYRRVGDVLFDVAHHDLRGEREEQTARLKMLDLYY